MAIETRISNAAYERLALDDSDRKWELWDGYPREKPGGLPPRTRWPRTSASA